MYHAQVAELVDALVSNTNEVTLVPVRLRPWVQQTPSEAILKGFFHFFYLTIQQFHSYFSLKVIHSGKGKTFVAKIFQGGSYAIQFLII